MNKIQNNRHEETPPEIIRQKAIQLFVDFYNNGNNIEGKMASSFKGADVAFCRRLVHTYMRFASEALQLVRQINNDMNNKIHYETACLMAVLIELLLMKTPKHAVQSQYTMVLNRLDKTRIPSFIRHVQQLYQIPECKPIFSPLEQQLAEYYKADKMQLMMNAHRMEPVFYFNHKDGRFRKIEKGMQVTKDADFLRGDCWVQDVAAALPVLLCGEVKNKHVLDVCAAPGGKTMQLAARGAIVDALELNPKRVEMMKSNMHRCQFNVNIIISDFLRYRPEKIYDIVLLDAPCTASGTARKNPDILHKQYQLLDFQETQDNMLQHAAQFINIGGHIIYCVCSVFPAETTDIINLFLIKNKNFKLEPIIFSEHSALIPDNIFSDQKDYFQCLPNETDGFFIAKLTKISS